MRVVAVRLALVALCLIVHWPGGAGFKSDDFVAIGYASELSNCLHDFVGPQYGLAFFLFYRPLITLSFGMDGLLFGPEPFGFYAMNALALCVALLLLFEIARMLSGGKLVPGFVLSVLWLCSPILVPSLRWVAGRVDTHVAVFILAALFAHLRCRRGGPRYPVWCFAVLALATKESAIGFPLAALGLDLLDPHPSFRRGPIAFGRSLPALVYLALIPAYFVLRRVVLGEFLGGYGFAAQAAIEPLAILSGWLHTLGLTLKPGSSSAGTGMAALLILTGIALWILERREGRAARLLGCGLVAAGAYGPLAQVLPAMRSGDQRFAYLASVTVLGVWVVLARRVARNRPAVTLVIGLLPLVWLLPGRAATRATMDAHDEFNANLIAGIATGDAQLADGDPVVLGGDAELANDPYRFLWGLGSVRKPPFAARPREVVTLRRLHRASEPVPDAFLARGLAGVLRVGANACSWIPTAEPVPDARLAPRVGFDGTIRAADIARLAKPAGSPGFRVGAGFGGVVAVCTSVGSCRVPIRARDGVLALHDLLAANATPGAAGPPMPLLLLLWNAMDLAKQSPIFVFWWERGRFVRATFRASADFVTEIRAGLRG